MTFEPRAFVFQAYIIPINRYQCIIYIAVRGCINRYCYVYTYKWLRRKILSSGMDKIWSCYYLVWYLYTRELETEENAWNIQNALEKKIFFCSNDYKVFSENNNNNQNINKQCLILSNFRKKSIKTVCHATELN